MRISGGSSSIVLFGREMVSKYQRELRYLSSRNMSRRVTNAILDYNLLRLSHSARFSCELQP